MSNSATMWTFIGLHKDCGGAAEMNVKYMINMHYFNFIALSSCRPKTTAFHEQP
jgi:hypothetical protein